MEESGEIHVRVVTSDGKPIEGFNYGDALPLKADALDAPIAWKHPLKELSGTPVRLEFEIRNARLYAFDLR